MPSAPDWLDLKTLPGWVQWIAQDANGQWWGYEVEPHKYHAGWYENEVGDRLQLEPAPPNPDWRQSLYQIRR